MTRSVVRSVSPYQMKVANKRSDWRYALKKRRALLRASSIALRPIAATPAARNAPTARSSPPTIPRPWTTTTATTWALRFGRRRKTNGGTHFTHMKQSIFVLTALVLSTLAALHAQTVTVIPSDAGLRVEIDGQPFTEFGAIAPKPAQDFGDYKCTFESEVGRSSGCPTPTA